MIIEQMLLNHINLYPMHKTAKDCPEFWEMNKSYRRKMKRKCLRKFKRKRQIGFLTSVGIEKSQLITITINAREQHKNVSVLSRNINLLN